MLVLRAYIRCPASARCPSRKAIDGVETLLIRPAEIVSCCLSEVITIGERLTRDSRNAAVDGFHLDSPAPPAVDSFPITAEFHFQRAVDPLCLGAAHARPNPIASLAQEPHTFISRPG